MPLFVLELDSERNALIVGEKSELGQTTLRAENVNWTADQPVADGTVAQCKIRYKATAVDCTLHPQEDGSVHVLFVEPLFGITPGQGAIFYNDEVCLGGGVIVKQKMGFQSGGARVVEETR